MIIAVLQQLTAAFLTTITAMIAKLINDMPISQFIYLRSMLSIIFGYIFLKQLQIKVYDYKQEIVKSLMIRGIMSSLGSFAFFFSLQYITLSEAFLITRLAPFWTSLISIYLQKTEQMTIKLASSLVLSFVSLWFIAQSKCINTQHQNNENSHYFGLVLVLLASISQGIQNCLVVTIHSQVDSIVISQYQNVFQMIPGIMLPLILGKQEYNFVVPDLRGTLLILIVAAGSQMQGILNLTSLRNGNLSIISNLSQSQIVFALLIDFLIFNIPISSSRIIGNVLMIASLLNIVNWKK